MRRSIWNQHRFVDYDKTKLNDLFKALRKENILARQNFSCCGSCGSYELHDMWENMEKSKKESKIGYVFYHRQDKETLDSCGEVHLRYSGFGRKRDKTIGKKIVELAENLGIKTEWDGDPGKCVLVNVKIGE